MTEPTYITVAGLRVPAELATKVIAAIRWELPSQDENPDDNAVVRMWLKEQIKALMLRYVLARGTEQVEQAVETTREFYSAEVETKKAQAIEAVGTIVDQEPPPVVA